jgi:Lrp/AsnC family transcriptional regulator
VIAAMPEIQECHRIGGDVDYLLKVVVPDMAGYDRSYKELIERLPALADVSALFSMERLKSTTGLPIPDET